ncbi:MAG TPA: IS200/IS605 family transposase, partial [Gemmatimonadales bacterium]|nr:IS200/IS605 family transposase [Gemmatimonadales bacterium]
MYQRLYYHLIWTTVERTPLIDAGLAGFLCRLFRAIARDEGVRILEIGMVQTHVHLLIAAPLRTDWIRLIQRLKGASSYVANREGLAGQNGPLRWARGYSIHTVSPRAVESARQYLASQPERHPDEAIEGWEGDR